MLPRPRSTLPLSPPASLTEIWRAASPESAAPIVADGTVATADGGTVLGRDPVTGTERWRYQRDMPLCGAIGAWNTVVAVYRDQRAAARSPNSTERPDNVRRSVPATPTTRSPSPTTARTWCPAARSGWNCGGPTWSARSSSDGRRADQPRQAPRPDCSLKSAAAGGTRVTADELPRRGRRPISVLDAAPKDNQEPQEAGSTLLTGPRADTSGPGSSRRPATAPRCTCRPTDFRGPHRRGRRRGHRDRVPPRHHHGRRRRDPPPATVPSSRGGPVPSSSRSPPANWRRSGR